MTLSAYFMSKSVFDLQGCRALTLALAKLSCIYLLNYLGYFMHFETAKIKRWPS